MPFVSRRVEPVRVGTVRLHNPDGRPRVKEGELEAVTNATLANALRQLACVARLAQQIFDELNTELCAISERGCRLKQRIRTVQDKVDIFDPRAVTVPESDLTEFWSIKNHFKSSHELSTGLFTADSRPQAVRRLYEEAAAVERRRLQRRTTDGSRSETDSGRPATTDGQTTTGTSRLRQPPPSLSPLLGRRKATDLPLDIETRKPAAMKKLRRWTSTEALGRVTAELDSSFRLLDSDPGQPPLDHTLPSPEERLHAIALKFPPEVVQVDVSGKSFTRMSRLRRTVGGVPRGGGGGGTAGAEDGSGTQLRRRSRSTRRGKRRNTIAGTDLDKELTGITSRESDETRRLMSGGTTTSREELEEDEGLPGERSGGSLGGGGGLTPGLTALDGHCLEKKSHLDNLKEWGRSRLRQIKQIDPAVRLRSLSNSRRKQEKEDANPHSSSGNWSASSESGHSTATSHLPRSSGSSGKSMNCQKKFSASSSVTSESTTLTPDEGETSSMYSCDTEGYYTSFHLDSGLKTLREEEPAAALHSTSALSINSQSNNNQSLAESEYELFGKGSTSTTASSAGTVCTTLLVPTSNGSAPSVPERTSSQLSKTLPERTNNRSTEMEKRETQSLKLTKNYDMKMLTFDEIKRINESKSNLTKENVKKHEKAEESSDNKQSIITVDVHHEHNRHAVPEKCGDSPDSGHNTCSSPVDSVPSPSLDLEMSECSDLEGVDRMERIRVKTTINSSRIPSMCVITPPQSDDEVSLNQSFKTVDSGEYVTIADIRGPNIPQVPNSPVLKRETEFISLTDLPKSENTAEPKRQGARVTLNAEGRVVYSSDSLRRRKAIHTTNTFEPGPNVIGRAESSPIAQRHVTKNIDTQSPLFANRKVITPNPVQKSQTKLIFKEETKLNMQSSASNTPLQQTRQPLASVNRALSPPSQRRDSISNQKQYFTKSTVEKSPNTIQSRPLSPLVSPTANRHLSKVNSPLNSPMRANSPKMIVKAKTTPRPVSPTRSKGAYVRVSQPSPPEDLAAKLAAVVKRNDSYRSANTGETTVVNPNTLGRRQYGPGVVAGPTLLSAIQQAARNSKAVPSEDSSRDLVDDTSISRGQSTWPRSTSTPTKTNESAGSLNFSPTTSPIMKSISPTKNSRSAMDLYAVIHESRKRIQSLQKPLATTSEVVSWPKVIPAKCVMMPQPMAPLENVGQERYVKSGYNSSLPRLQVQSLEESPRSLQRRSYARGSSLAADRHGPTPPTSRTDFKRLLLAKACSGPVSPRGSAVERLRHRDQVATVRPLNRDVLSSTILEDCDDEDEHQVVQQVTSKPQISDSRVSEQQSRSSQSKTHSTLETAL